ncbi:LysR family transcriptional regulator [Rhizobium sp. RM]|uniref:LysR family transcriptional regulator n=1 Tax=Rhizobium sp. RM TaxID=2748079 RepID=UPI00110F230C|nr:LysR family transcriptional regulator [Rhizobium sp. RM]NWJ27641.1 LysR family transcriptional regulator [Rhizobium sp. RM]TMV18911.1 LysR family transcriptional regulator [Rhizobium sp. Td3]
MDSRSGEMLAFIKVVETGSFSAAGKRLDMTASAVSKVVTRIEQRLGVLLLKRSTRAVSVTPEGKQFYENSVRIISDIDQAESDVAAHTSSPRGVLRVNASLPFGNHWLLPVLPEFRQRYPEIVLDISLTDAVVDLNRDSVDIAIRMGPLADADFHARLLGRSRRAVVAAPTYLEKHGSPKHPDDLAMHQCFNFNFRRSMDEWPFLVNAERVNVAIRGSTLTNNGETMRQLTLDGLGISRLGMFHIARDIADGRRVEVLPDYNAGDIEDINVVYSSRRHMPTRSRVFIDYMVEQLQPRLQLG